MFFTSYEFLFLFLPVAFVGFYLLQKYQLTVLAECWLVLLSLVFYWTLDGYQFLALLASAFTNYVLSFYIGRYKQGQPRRSFGILWAGIAFNVLFLLSFKYIGTWFKLPWSVAVPLGISFFSLQQITYLVGTYSENLPRPPLHRYLLFISFFSYVVAGPVVTAKEIVPQYEQMSRQRCLQLLLPAVTLFSLGLFKKVVLADNIAPYVDKVFTASGELKMLSAADAWCGALLYPLQLYFDFSGYSDMAAGLAGIFGIHLPRNFHSPYKAGSIMDFWRRWHMSVTRFFTHFVYMQLVVKLMRIAIRRHLRGVPRFVVTVLLPMILTFLLIGVWHGAGTNFVAFGLLMGIALSINHVWALKERPALPKGVGWLLTMAVVVCGMIFDRSANLSASLNVFKAMAGLGGGAKELLDLPVVAAWLSALWAVALFAPNTHEIMGKYGVVLKDAWDDVPARWKRLQWSLSPWGVAFEALAFSISIVFIPQAADFIYYRI
jgi:alginate O-acetyltransferase complex protein AlgI